MTITRFDRTRDLIIVSGHVWGRHGPPAPLRLCVDTGASETLIVPEILDELGYGARQGEAITVIRSAVGREQGYLIRVAGFECLGFQFSDFRVHAHDLPDSYDLDGLLGLNFLDQFDYAIHSRRGRILTSHAAE
jgi:predicted aspartyl protease